MVNKGTPGLVFLPAKDFSFEASETTHKIEVPIEAELEDPKLQAIFDGKDSYKLVTDVDGATVISLSALTKAMFVQRQYPSLAENEMFTPLVLVIADDKITIGGKVLTFVEEVEETE